ncbi:RNA-guided endonuclease InsQ/TnpB family protein [Microseira wollei]|uniref:Transposase n=1 Tax=Microseira wollei NIES-4236 TaxID=2530354 RepID=A0AAV3XDW7_9CYAN|nr:transposase [Microseira wollei]GET39651.1 transposase [Microseira wollei NIES-4236]
MCGETRKHGFGGEGEVSNNLPRPYPMQVAFEKLQVKNMVKNHHLAKSISDAARSQFTEWLEYLGRVYGRVVVGVPPQYTSQNCSSCGQMVKKSLSVRTHVCQCGCVLDRDHNAAIIILDRAHQTDWLSINQYRGTHGN